MAARTPRDVFLAPERDAFVDTRLNSGAYRTAGKISRAALRLLRTKPRRGGRGTHGDVSATCTRQA